jgi:hypothetical protein
VKDFEKYMFFIRILKQNNFNFYVPSATLEIKPQSSPVVVQISLLLFSHTSLSHLLRDQNDQKVMLGSKLVAANLFGLLVVS